MWTEETLRAEARLIAIEKLLAKSVGAQFLGMTAAQQEAALQGMSASMEALTVPGLDAAQSDALSAEVRDGINRLLRAVREELDSAAKGL